MKHAREIIGFLWISGIQVDPQHDLTGGKTCEPFSRASTITSSSAARIQVSVIETESVEATQGTFSRNQEIWIQSNLRQHIFEKDSLCRNNGTGELSHLVTVYRCTFKTDLFRLTQHFTMFLKLVSNERRDRVDSILVSHSGDLGFKYGPETGYSAWSFPIISSRQIVPQIRPRPLPPKVHSISFKAIESELLTVWLNKP